MNKSNHSVTLPLRDYEQYNKAMEELTKFKEILRESVIVQDSIEPNVLVKTDNIIKLALSVSPYKLDENCKIVTI